MTEKSYSSHRPRYVQFRFQESLRKYQNPPRKFPKLNESVCKNCFRKSCDSGRQSRLIRLCETRRLYHATSRQKASEFSRKKEAIQLSHDKVSGHVSDFSCTDNNPIVGSSMQKQKSSLSNRMFDLNLTNQKQKRIEVSEKKINWSIKIRQTPIKQQIRQELKNMEGTPIKQLQQCEVNVVKVKDIDFHIGLVEELHQKINDYIRNQAPERQQEILQHTECYREPSLVEFQEINQQELEEMQGRIEIHVEEKQNGQMQDQIQICVEELKEETKEDEMKETPNIQSTPKCKKTEQGEKTNGRIEIKGEKGSCFLSARILKKLLTSNLSPNRITNTVIRFHPYLGDVSHVLQTLSQTKQIN